MKTFIALLLLATPLYAQVPKPPPQLCVDDSCTSLIVSKKWHPGHYMLTYTPDNDYTTRCNEIANEPSVVGIKMHASWRDIEPTKGVYDVTKIRNWLTACGAHGKRIVADIEPRSYTTGLDITAARKWLPDYIVDDPAYGWAPFTSKGVTAKIYLQSVTDRWILLQQAVAAQLDNDPNLEAISVGPGESAPGWGKNPVPADYSASAWNTQMQRRVVAVAAAWPHTLVTQGFNWLPGTLLDKTNMIAALAANQVAQGGPDIYGDLSRLTDGQKVLTGALGGISYVGQIPVMHDVQSPELGGTCGWDGNYTPAQIFPVANGTLGASHIFWIRNTCGSTAGNWSTGILPFIRANPVKNTGCPKTITCN